MSGDELERHLSLSLDEPEVLRREMQPAQDAPLFGGDHTPGSFDADAQMDPPPDGTFNDLPGSVTRRAPLQVRVAPCAAVSCSVEHVLP